MKKPISPTVHGIIDYLFAGLLMAGPTLFNLQGAARRLSYGLAGDVAASGAMTDYPPALQRKIPLRIHKRIDGGHLATLLLAVGTLKQRRARYFFLGMLVTGLATVLLTDWKEEEE